MVRYIADLHLYDPAITYWEASPETRVERIIENWKRTVSDEDLTFILGDIGMQSQITFDTMKSLTGRKILVRGNHDDVHSWTPEWKSIFEGIYDYVLSNGVLLIHRPQDRLMFNLDIDVPPANNYFVPKPEHIGKAEWVIHGHLHTLQAEEVAGDYIQYVHEVNRYNCAADMIDFCPRNILELAYYKEQVINTRKGDDYGN